MLGMMMHKPLSVIEILKFAVDVHRSAELVSVRIEGDIHRKNYPESFCRAAQLAYALTALGIEQGTRVAILAWNGYRHFELYFRHCGPWSCVQHDQSASERRAADLYHPSRR